MTTKSVLLVVKERDSEARALANEITEYLKSCGCDCESCEHRTDAPGEPAKSTMRPYDLVLVLGGDGTLISAARRLYSLGAPLVGINLGQVGFLADLNREDWRERLNDLVCNEIEVSRRMLLEYRVLREDKEIVRGVAVNDIVISRGALARLIRLGICFDGKRVTSMRSDGVIVSTPTGSTAYTISAGGPLIYPDTAAYCVTPICPFLSGFKPLVLPDDRVLSVHVQEREPCDVCLTEDGQELVNLRSGDRIEIKRHGTDLLLADVDGRTYFDRLTDKGFLTEGR